MFAITIGFRTPHRGSEAAALYVGHDAAEALRIAQSNPPGFAMCQVFKNPTPAKRAFSDGSGELPGEELETLKLEVDCAEVKELLANAIEAAKNEAQAEFDALKAESEEKLTAALAEIAELKAELEAAKAAAPATVETTEENTAPETPSGEGSPENDSPGQPDQPALEGLAGQLKPRRGK